MSTTEAVILAIVEGITEFLPISSTGHMIIAQALLKVQASSFTKMYLVNIQFGAILSVLVLYYKRFFNLKSIDFYLKLLVAFIPAAILGFALNKYIDALLESVTTVAVSLIVGGVVIIVTDKIFRSQIQELPTLDEPIPAIDDENNPAPAVQLTNIPLSFLQSLIVGLYQTIAMIPGVSRSAATIIGGLTQGLRMKDAAEFSFFLAVPTITAAAAYKTYKGFESIHGTDMQTLFTGNVVAFLVAMVAIKFFVTFISKYGMKLFGYYRIIIGLTILIALYVFHLPLDIIK